ncbi:GNAT family N-acetyltransferase [Aliikangiella maris]|uniref:GNAT family N-acetyltransferase n=2 Tax=Aliikangiella maris TaxID=3162458 RepID=A0ABV2BP16_9GAMM
MIDELQTKRFILQPLKSTHKLFYCELYQDENLTEFIDGVRSKQKLDKAFRTALRFNKYVFSHYTWVIIDRITTEQIGICGLVDKANDNVDIGTVIIQKMQNKKIAKEVLARLMDYAYLNLNKRVITGYSYLENIKSSRLMRSLGFECCLDSRKEVKVNYWQLSKEQWLINNVRE